MTRATVEDRGGPYDLDLLSRSFFQDQQADQDNDNDRSNQSNPITTRGAAVVHGTKTACCDEKDHDEAAHKERGGPIPPSLFDDYDDASDDAADCSHD